MKFGKVSARIHTQHDLPMDGFVKYFRPPKAGNSPNCSF
jgi:hypothetical protein